MSGEFWLTIPYKGNTGHSNKTMLKIGSYQFPYIDWVIDGSEFAANSQLYLRIPSGYIEGIVRYISLASNHIHIDFDGTWRGKYNGLLFGKCAYGEFHVYPHTGIVYESRFFPSGYDWAITLEFYHLLSLVARHQGFRPEKKLSMEKFIELCFAAGVYYAKQNLDQTVLELEHQLSFLSPKIKVDYLRHNHEDCWYS